jgi:hypothetical protein
VLDILGIEEKKVLILEVRTTLGSMSSSLAKQFGENSCFRVLVATNKRGARSQKPKYHNKEYIISNDYKLK